MSKFIRSGAFSAESTAIVSTRSWRQQAYRPRDATNTAATVPAISLRQRRHHTALTGVQYDRICEMTRYMTMMKLQMDTVRRDQRRAKATAERQATGRQISAPPVDKGGTLAVASAATAASRRATICTNGTEDNMSRTDASEPGLLSELVPELGVQVQPLERLHAWAVPSREENAKKFAGMPRFAPSVNLTCDDI